MIVGIVRGREALLRLTIRGFRGREQETDAVVDSGYTGWLTLPPAVIAALNLRWQSFGRGILADGSVSTFDIYQAKVVWDGRLRRVFVDEFDATPLVERKRGQVRLISQRRGFTAPADDDQGKVRHP